MSRWMTSRTDGRVAGSADLDALLPRSRDWRSRFRPNLPGNRICDSGPEGFPPPQSERLLQCVWYDNALRPPELRTTEGERVRVLSPGRWNLEAGPDFLGAVVEIGPQRRRISGDVEVHLRPGDWEAHGHGADPRYRNVRWHITYVSGAAPESLPRAALRISLRDALRAMPSFSFDRIDPAAYPYAVRTTPCPCAGILASWTPEERAQLLESAGEERVRRKAERIRPLIRDRGEEQLFYEETLCALGYRDNKTPFRLLAERIPLEELRAESGGDPEIAYALLVGCSGLLPESPRPVWDAETRRWLRGLWDVWWPRSAKWADRGFCRADWRLSGFRPSNHPLRRLAAAAWFFARPESLFQTLRQDVRAEADGGIRRALAKLSAPGGGYWEKRLTIGGAVQRRPVALLGRARAAAILANALLPILAALGDREAFRDGWAADLPAEGEAGVLRQTSVALFGPDVPPSLIRPALRRQGLLQIFQDFCLHDRSGCRDCDFPGLLSRGRA
ncbi:MAG: DUF2851 family protein [Kiritimatiellia bacterium]|nr:DUF2851 family protein [Kiritimatiellia bacterium]